MTTNEASQEIGCSVSTIKALIAKGELTATKIKTTATRFGFVYNVDPKSVKKFKQIPQSVGYPRGRRRK